MHTYVPTDRQTDRQANKQTCNICTYTYPMGMPMLKSAQPSGVIVSTKSYIWLYILTYWQICKFISICILIHTWGDQENHTKPTLVVGHSNRIRELMHLVGNHHYLNGARVQILPNKKFSEVKKMWHKEEKREALNSHINAVYCTVYMLDASLE